LCLECTNYWMESLHSRRKERWNVAGCENMGLAPHLVCVGVTLRAMAWLIDVGVSMPDIGQ